MSSKLLLIRGLGHSGTTILDLALGAHPRILGLGEAARILRKPLPSEEHRGPARLRGELRHERLCTCGQVAACCPVWGEVLEWLPVNDDLPLAQKLRHLMTVASNAGPNESINDRWLIDSYQDDLELPFLQDADLDVRIVFLIRDLRSWVHSRSRQRHPLFGSHSSLLHVARWLHVNRRFEKELRRCGKPLFFLGYEELALSPELSLGRLCDWMGLDFNPLMLTPGLSTGSHILSGNRVRFDPEKTKHIAYDAAWLSAPRASASLAMAVPSVRRMNRRLVYSNRFVGS